MDASLLAACTGATLQVAQACAGPLSDAMSAFKIDTSPVRIAMFLANVSTESGRLTKTVENLNYSVDALLSKFSRERISEADARAYGRSATQAANQRAIANCIYGGAWGLKNLGNVGPDDGWIFRGAGWLQSTGLANARALTAQLRMVLAGQQVPDFTKTPEAMALPQWAAMSAAAFIDRNGINRFADSGDFDGYCDSVNLGRKTKAEGDAIGFAERQAIYNNARRALGI